MKHFTFCDILDLIQCQNKSQIRKIRCRRNQLPLCLLLILKSFRTCCPCTTDAYFPISPSTAGCPMG